MSHHPIFVYGTLRTGQGNWRRLLDGHTTAETPAALPGARLYAAGLPYAVATADPYDIVIGDLIDIHPNDYDQVLAALDRLEGHPHHYVRTELPTATTHGTRLAWVYLAAPDVAAVLPRTTLIHTGDWLPTVTARRLAQPGGPADAWRAVGNEADPCVEGQVNVADDTVVGRT